MTVVADDVGIVESVCGAGHRYATCACQQPDCTGWKAISSGSLPGSFDKDTVGVPVVVEVAALGADG